MSMYLVRRIMAAVVAVMILIGFSVSSASAATTPYPEVKFFGKQCRSVSFQLQLVWPEKGNLTPVTYAVFDDSKSRLLAEGTVPAGEEDDAIDVLRTFRFKAFSGRHNLSAWVDLPGDKLGPYLASTTSVRTNCISATINSVCVLYEGFWAGEIAVDVTLKNSTTTYRHFIVTIIGKKLGTGKSYLAAPNTRFIVPQMIVDYAAYGGKVVSVIVSTPGGKELTTKAIYWSDCTKG